MAKEKKRVMTAAILIVLVLGAALCLMGCSKGDRYKVDLGGSDFCYDGVKKSYRAGEEVTLYFTLIATDTEYAFYLDEEPISFDYDQKKGFIIRFTMPNHDVKLEYTSVNSMVYVPPAWDGEADVMLLDCYRAQVATAGGDGHHELVITTTEDPTEVRLDEYVQEEGEEETCTSYYIPYHVAQDLLILVDDYGLAQWNDMEDGIRVDGVKKVCKFWAEDRHIRVSTEQMPEDGEEILDHLFELLDAYTQ